MSSAAVREEVSATVMGPWPGTDPVEAAKTSLGLLTPPHLPTLLELPGRGIGSDAMGRTAGLLVELPVDIQPYGWRFVDRPGNDYRRAVSALSTDINVLADVAGAAGLPIAELKLQLVGPLSLAAAIHLHYGERALGDFGARREITQSLAAGLLAYVDKVRAAVPGAELCLQIDEPHIGQILSGTIPTVSGYRTLRSIPASELRQCWSEIVRAARDAGFATLALNLAQGAPLGSPGAGMDLAQSQSEATSWRKALEIAVESGVDALALPLSSLDTGAWEILAGALESGIEVWAGAVPVRAGQQPPSYSVLVERIMRPWHGLGLPASSLNLLRVTPETTLATVSPRQARAIVEKSQEVAAALTDLRTA